MDKTFLDYKTESKKNWGRYAKDPEEESLSLEQLNAGCMLRIADAVETIAKERVEELERNLREFEDNSEEKVGESHG